MSDYIRSTSGSFTYEEGPPLPFLGLQPLLRIASSQNEFPRLKKAILFKRIRPSHTHLRLENEKLERERERKYIYIYTKTFNSPAIFSFSEFPAIFRPELNE